MAIFGPGPRSAKDAQLHIERTDKTCALSSTAPSEFVDIFAPLRAALDPDLTSGCCPMRSSLCGCGATRRQAERALRLESPKQALLTSRSATTSRQFPRRIGLLDTRLRQTRHAATGAAPRGILESPCAAATPTASTNVRPIPAVAIMLRTCASAGSRSPMLRVALHALPSPLNGRRLPPPNPAAGPSRRAAVLSFFFFFFPA